MLNIPGSIVKPLKVARDLYPLFLAMSGCTVLPRNLPPPNKTLCNQLAHKSVHHATHHAQVFPGHRQRRDC